MSDPASPPTTEQHSARKKKARSVPHARAIPRDRSNRPLVPPPDEEVAARLTAPI